MLPKEFQAQLPFMKNGVAQVGILVEDIEQAVEQYWKVCGIGPWRIYTYQKPLIKTMHYRGQPGDYAMKVALATVGPLVIELIEIIGGDNIYQEYVEARGYGLHHLGVVVDDVPAAIAQAEEAGYPVTQDGAGYGQTGDGHFAYLDTEDKLGIIIELMEIPEVRVSPERIYPEEADSQ